MKPFALSLQPNVKAELQWMDQLGIISKLDEPTDWYAGILVVHKHDRKVCICMDLTKFSESVHRETQIILSVHYTFSQLGGVKNRN